MLNWHIEKRLPRERQIVGRNARSLARIKREEKEIREELATR